MTGTVPLALIQADPEVLAQVQRIAWSQMVMAAITVLVGVAIIAAIIVAIRLIRSAEQTVKQLAQRAQPIIDTANGIAANANQLSQSVKKQADEVLETVHEVNDRLRDAADAAEQRVRDFGAVLDVVREETESILLDGAAAARGVHVAATRLREPGSRQALERPTERPVPAPAPPRTPIRTHPEE